MAKKTDDIYSKPVASSPFNFDQSVAEVFPDMIERSVPGYSRIINNISKFAAHFVTDNSHCYDLGCSLGAVSLAISQGVEASNVSIIGVDNSAAMIARCQTHINAFKHNVPIQLLEDDIRNIKIENASLAVLNFTLQFIAKSDRESLLDNVCKGLIPGGALILSEKIRFEDPELDELMIKLHHQFKRENGYSDLEISQKRNALENVLIPETLETHKARLKQVGFKHVACWLKEYNFASFIAVK